MKNDNSYLIKYLKRSSLNHFTKTFFRYIDLVKEGNSIDLSKEFDIVFYKEFVRLEFNTFIKIFNMLDDTTDNVETLELLDSKSELYDYVNELLSDEEAMNNYVIYCIQKSLGKLMDKVVGPVRKNFDSYLRDYKCVKEGIKEDNLSIDPDIVKKLSYVYDMFSDNNIEITSYNGCFSATELLKYLYKSCGLKPIDREEYVEAVKIKEMSNIINNSEYEKEIDKTLFKACVSYDSKGQYTYYPKNQSDSYIFENVKSGNVASLISNRSLLKMTL